MERQAEANLRLELVAAACLPWASLVATSTLAEPAECLLLDLAAACPSGKVVACHLAVVYLLLVWNSTAKQGALALWAVEAQRSHEGLLRCRSRSGKLLSEHLQLASFRRQQISDFKQRCKAL